MLRPVTVITPAALAAGENALVLDASFASLTSALSGGVVLVAYALAIGAGPMAIGILSAIPFIAQAAQLPAIALVERVRQRKLIGVVSITAARIVILMTAALPFVPSHRWQLVGLVAAQIAIGTLNSFGSCAVNSWFQQLVQPERLGHFFARRLVWGTAMACVGVLVVGQLAELEGTGHALAPFALAFAGAGLAGLASSWFLARAPEPQMAAHQGRRRVAAQLRQPFADPNFRRVAVFVAAWSAVSNLAAPFLTVYLLKQLRLPVGTVTGLWVTSQVATALTLFLWGRLSDRLSNKAILAVALPTYLLATIGLVFSDAPSDPSARLALLTGLHAVMGAASGGIGLAVGNLGLKLAPHGEATPHLAVLALMSAAFGGAAPLVAGAVAEWFAPRELTLLLQWESPSGHVDLAVFDLAHWEFLFAISALAGIYVMHALSRVREGPDISERRVIQEFGLEAVRLSSSQLSSIGGLVATLFPFGRLLERHRRRPRSRGAPAPVLLEGRPLEPPA
jgi:MFS family permease